jgi:hypothetical protein
MDIEEEDDLVESINCPFYIKELINSLPLIPEDDLSAFLTYKMEIQDQHEKIAASIISDRYKYMGAKDYLYCYRSICLNDQEAMDNYMAAMMELVHKYKKVTVQKVNRFVSMYFYSTMLSTSDERSGGSGTWKFFKRGLWYGVNKQEFCNSITKLFETTSCASMFTESSATIEKAVVTACRFLDSGSIRNELFFRDFHSSSDNKNKSFAFRSEGCYDMQNSIVRKGLPSDICTLRSEADVDFEEWKENKRDMIEAIREWLPDKEVVDTYLNTLACAMSEFQPRYAFVNCGTGADGKTTFFLILRHVFGSYCGTCPAAGPAVDTRNANDATPVINSLTGKRMCQTSDVKDMVSLIKSPGFKNVSGGDPIYKRGLHKEADSNPSNLKMLILVNTNQMRAPLAELSEVTRIKVVRWETKNIIVEDKDIIPVNKIGKYRLGKNNYSGEFINKYANTFITELMRRHARITKNGHSVKICQKIIDWTRATVTPVTMSSFLQHCVEDVVNDEDTSSNSNYDETEESSKVDMILSRRHERSYSDSDENIVSVQDLFSTYMMWRKSGFRMNKSDPSDLENFVSHLEFFKPVHSDEYGDRYVKDIRLKSTTEVLGISYSYGSSGGDSRGYIEASNSRGGSGRDSRKYGGSNTINSVWSE